MKKSAVMIHGVEIGAASSCVSFRELGGDSRASFIGDNSIANAAISLTSQVVNQRVKRARFEHEYSTQITKQKYLSVLIKHRFESFVAAL